MEGTNQFINNSADNSGGAIQWDDIEPIGILNSYFENN